MKKRGQVTIFVIIAVVIVALILAYFLFRPAPETKDFPDTPQGYMQECMYEYTRDSLNVLTLQGGFISPEFYKLYQDNKVAYLCYTEEHYKGCTMQVPFIKQHIQNEIISEIHSKNIDCLNSLRENLEKKGNTITLGSSSTEVKIKPDKIITSIKTDMTITKDSTEKIREFKTEIPSPLYNQIMIATSILNWEARFGDSDPMTYMIYYPNIKVEKLKQGDGSTIYIITDRESEKQFMFASRSFIWPAGFVTTPT